MTDKEKEAKIVVLEKQLSVVKKLQIGLNEDFKKEADAAVKEGIEAQIILVDRQVKSLEDELGGMKSAPEAKSKKLRSVFGRR